MLTQKNLSNPVCKKTNKAMYAVYFFSTFNHVFVIKIEKEISALE